MISLNLHIMNIYYVNIKLFYKTMWWFKFFHYENSKMIFIANEKKEKGFFKKNICTKSIYLSFYINGFTTLRPPKQFLETI
jgi:hypothetical protein